MQYLYEYSDNLNSPYEVFLYDTNTMPFPVRSHWHYFMEILYMVDGTGMVECDGNSYILEEGDLILFHPESIHAIYTATNRSLKFWAMKFDVNKLYTENSYVPKLRLILNSANKKQKAQNYFKAAEIKYLNVAELFEECRNELEEKSYGYDIIVNNRVCYLLMQIIRLWRDQGLNTDMVTEHFTEADSIHAITAYIDAHAGEPIKVEDLADMCNMSYSYFAKNFKQYYGRSCKEYIEFIRVSKVEDLLLFTDFDLSYISQETGFSDSSHLIKIFRKWKGLTPKQYKKQRAIKL